MTTNDTKPTPSATAPQGVKPHRVIKLGVDVHWREHVVVRRIDGSSPQPPQRFSPEAFVAWVAKQVQLADEVHCCSEAGPFGFVLHRRLVGFGVKSLVVRPRNWDEYSKKVKTDRRDALALLSCLDRYVAGNAAALTSIRVPSEEEERSRRHAKNSVSAWLGSSLSTGGVSEQAARRPKSWGQVEEIDIGWRDCTARSNFLNLTLSGVGGAFVSRDAQAPSLFHARAAVTT